MSLFLARLGGRHYLILLMAVVATVVMAFAYWSQVRSLESALIEQESLRLRERLSLEQNQLELHISLGNRLASRRQVSALALYNGMREAFLVDEAGQVLASFYRSDMGRPLTRIIQERPSVPSTLAPLARGIHLDAIDVQILEGSRLVLVGRAPLQDGSRLIVLADLDHPRALRTIGLEKSIWYESVVLVLVMGLLAWMLHLLWFRRAQRLAGVLDAIGRGRLDLRSGMTGHDELALIGRAADRMAQNLHEDQQALRDMKELIDRSPVVMIEWLPEPGWPILNVSGAVSQWGYAPADLMGSHISYLQLIHPDDLSRTEAEVSRHADSTQDVFVQEYRICRADGRWVWLEDRTRFDRDAHGHVVRITGVLMDVTDRHEALRSQQESAEQLRHFFELPFIGMGISHPVSRTWMNVNTRLCQILGYSRREMIGASWETMTHPDDLGANRQLFEELLAGQRDNYQMNKRFLRKSGEPVEVEMDVRAVREPDGTLRHLFTTIQDVTERRKAEADIARSEARLREAQRIARIGNWEVEVASGNTHWSDETFRIHGFRPDDPALPFQRAMELVHKDDAQRLADGFGRLQTEGGAFEADYRIHRPDGQLRHLHFKAEAVMAGGKAERIVGTVQDVTDLVEARQSRDRLAVVLENNSDLVCMTDADGKTFYFNQAARAFWGVTDETTLQQGIPKLHPPEFSRRILQEYIPAAMRDGRWSGETVTIDCHGREVPVLQQIMAHRDDDGHLLYLSTIMRDISDLKRWARQVEEHGQMLQQAEAIASLGSWAYDAQTSELRWSPQTFINVGLPPAERPPSVDDFCARAHPEDAPRLRAAIEQMLRAEEPPEVTFRTHPDLGQVRWLRRTVRRIDRQDQGMAPRFIGTLLDITSVVLAQERLREINQQLEQRVVERTEELRRINRELEAFTYSVSHDLKAPLRGIAGYSQLLDEEHGDKLDEEARQFLRRIRRGVQQMGDLINDLLDYSRMERHAMEREDVALLPLADQMLELYAADIERLGTRVVNHVEPIHLAIDREGLSVALRNLIGNAIKFSRDSQPPEIEIGASAENGKTHIWVRDNGIGFDMKYYDRIFGMFQRLHRSEDYAGTGVGLAMVAKAVERMGGRVWAESEPGQGSTFHMEFSE